MRTAHAVSSRSALLIVLLATRAAGQEFFPHQELDFWNEGAPRRVARAAPARPGAAAGLAMPAPAPRSPARDDDGEFRWEDLEDPTTAAFWDDGGNYVPPRPVRIAAADPTPDNVARFLRWQKRKLAAISALHAEVKRQVDADAPPRRAPAPGTVVADAATQARLLAEAPEPIDWSRLELLFFHAAACPHCQESVATVRELERLGARVIPVQTDWREREALLPGSVPYTAEIAREQPIDAVPTWVASYGGDRVTMQGKVTVQSIEVTLKLSEQQKRQRAAVNSQFMQQERGEP